MTPAAFIAALTPAALACQRQTQVPASLTIAQAALESGWGGSQLAVQGFNLFGVKADASWKGPVLTMNTREVIHGQWVMVPARWRKYSSWQGSIDDHAAFLLDNPRYHAAFMFHDGVRFAQAVAAAGYATDPNYADKVIGVIHAHNLGTLDRVTA